MLMMTAQSPSGNGERFATRAQTHNEAIKHFSTVRMMYPHYYVTVHDTATGIVHTFRSRESYRREIFE